MKSKILIVIIIKITILLLLSGCSFFQNSDIQESTSNNSTVLSNKTINNKPKQSTIQRNHTNTSEDAPKTEIVTPSKPYVDYSSYTGNWVCKEKTTSIEIKVDNKGNVTGSITTVVGSHVPSSLIKGVIKEDILTSKLLVDDTDTGTLVLSFTKPQVLIGNVELDKGVSYWSLEQGEMRFIRYSIADNSSNDIYEDEAEKKAIEIVKTIHKAKYYKETDDYTINDDEYTHVIILTYGFDNRGLYEVRICSSDYPLSVYYFCYVDLEKGTIMDIPPELDK